MTPEIAKRLEYLRGELRAERISYGELSELQGLAPFIEKDDVELLEAAGVPEFGKDFTNQHDWNEKEGRCLNCGATDCGQPCPERGTKPDYSFTHNIDIAYARACNGRCADCGATPDECISAPCPYYQDNPDEENG